MLGETYNLLYLLYNHTYLATDIKKSREQNYKDNKFWNWEFKIALVPVTTVKS